MKVCDLQFDEDLETSVFISALKKKVRLVLSDDLEASEQQLSEEYKQKIVQFLEEISIWYNKTIDAVKQYADGKYGIKDVSNTDIELMAIFPTKLVILKVQQTNISIIIWPHVALFYFVYTILKLH